MPAACQSIQEWSASLAAEYHSLMLRNLSCHRPPVRCQKDEFSAFAVRSIAPHGHKSRHSAMRHYAGLCRTMQHYAVLCSSMQYASQLSSQQSLAWYTQ